MRLNPARLQALDEGLGVIALVGPERRAKGQALAESSRRLALGRSGRQRRLGRRHKTIAVLHQDVAKIGETALLPGALPKEPRVFVRRRGVGLVRALGLAEVDGRTFALPPALQPPDFNPIENTWSGRMHGATGGAPKGNKNALKHGEFTARLWPSKKRSQPWPGWPVRRWRRSSSGNEACGGQAIRSSVYRQIE